MAWIYVWNQLMWYDVYSSNTVFGSDPSLSHWRCLLILIENDPCFCKFAFDQWLLLLQDVWKSLSHNGWPEKVVDKKQQQKNSASSNCCCVSSERMHFPYRKIWESGLPIPFQWLHVTSSKPNQNHRHLPLIQWQLDHLSKCGCQLFKGVAPKLSKPLKFFMILNMPPTSSRSCFKVSLKSS